MSTIIINREQAEKLMTMFSSERDPAEEITLHYDAVRGLIAWETELPEEGSMEL